MKKAIFILSVIIVLLAGFILFQWYEKQQIQVAGSNYEDPMPETSTGDTSNGSTTDSSNSTLEIRKNVTEADRDKPSESVVYQMAVDSINRDLALETNKKTLGQFVVTNIEKMDSQDGTAHFSFKAWADIVHTDGTVKEYFHGEIAKENTRWVLRDITLDDTVGY